jgi:ribosomal protein S18 acetylase RimI-like enzyme
MLVEEYPKLYKKVVIGGGFKKNSEILDVIDCNTELIYYPDARVMLKLMLESDIAVSAGGQTLYELARVGVPTIAIGVASNQTHNLENWHKIGFIEYAGFWNDINLLNNIINKMNSCNDVSTRIRKCEIGRRYVDGKGAFRIVRYCLNKYYTDKIRLRTLESTDINNIYYLSNDDVVRLNSFNTYKIRFEDHVKWFEQKILDNNNLFLVTEIDNDFAGQVRFDFKGDGAVVSLSITKKYRELGLGVNILEKSIEYLRLNASFIKIINAYIKEDNKSSVKLFEKTGFKFVKMVSVDNQRALNYIYKI